MIIDKPYYEDNTRISNSSIGWFLKKGPLYFRNMLDGKEEGLKLPQLEKGTMIHEYILQPDEFWNDYTILEYEVPKVKQQKDFCDWYSIFKDTNPLEDDDKLLLDSYNKVYSNKLSEDAKLSIAKDFALRYDEYIKSKSLKNNKKAISFADLNMLKTIKSNIEKHKKANELLTNTPGVESHNEFHINWTFPIKTDSLKMDENKTWYAPCKSLLDRCIFDHVNKKIILIDLKTTSDVYNFKHSVEEFDYYRQIAYYLLAIAWYMKDQDIDISDYDCEAYIIAIQTNGSYEVRVFNMFNETELDSRKNIIINALSELSYHYQTNNWEHTRSYYEGNGTEELE
jgi:hypothetical protein